MVLTLALRTNSLGGLDLKSWYYYGEHRGEYRIARNALFAQQMPVVTSFSEDSECSLPVSTVMAGELS
jgi:hypothetical protein